MADYYIGCDPGQKGAWAILGPNDYVKTHPFQSFSQFKTELETYQGSLLVGLEKVHGFPGQGANSTFSFGAQFGGWLCLLELMRLPHLLIPPQTWQKAMLGSFPKGESKPRALDYAQRRFPNLNLKKSDDGVVDALLIALYVRKEETGLL